MGARGILLKYREISSFLKPWRGSAPGRLRYRKRIRRLSIDLWLPFDPLLNVTKT